MSSTTRWVAEQACSNEQQTAGVQGHAAKGRQAVMVRRPRAALRAAFPRLALTPAATRTLLELKTPFVKRDRTGETLCSPMGMLRFAQVKAMILSSPSARGSRKFSSGSCVAQLSHSPRRES